MPDDGATYRTAREANMGWIAAGLVIAAVLVAGAALWFTFHGL